MIALLVALAVVISVALQRDRPESSGTRTDLIFAGCCRTDGFAGGISRHQAVAEAAARDGHGQARRPAEPAPMSCPGHGIDFGALGHVLVARAVAVS